LKYSIQYSEEAKQDIRDIYEYIAFELLAPDTAAQKYKSITEAVRELDEMPLRFPLYKDMSWSALGMRWFPVDSYLVFFFTNEDTKEVSIARIMYKGRDISKQLNAETE
jgi:toxin ParE1/3/4